MALHGVQLRGRDGAVEAHGEALGQRAAFAREGRDAAGDREDGGARGRIELRHRARGRGAALGHRKLEQASLGGSGRVEDGLRRVDGAGEVVGHGGSGTPNPAAASAPAPAP